MLHSFNLSTKYMFEFILFSLFSSTFFELRNSNGEVEKKSQSFCFIFRSFVQLFTNFLFVYDILILNLNIKRFSNSF